MINHLFSLQARNSNLQLIKNNKSIENITLVKTFMKCTEFKDTLQNKTTNI